MNKSVALPALTALALALTACGGGEKNEIAINNETTVLNADEGLAVGNEAIVDPAFGNQAAPTNFADTVPGNAATADTLSNAH